MSSQHPFHYQELASIRVRGLHGIHPTTQQNLVTKTRASILRVRGIHSIHPNTQQKGNQCRLLNSCIAQEFTSSIPLPTDSIHQGQGTSQHPSHNSTKCDTQNKSQHTLGLGDFTASIPLLHPSGLKDLTASIPLLNKIWQPIYELASLWSVDFTASIPLLSRIGNQVRLLNSFCL